MNRIKKAQTLLKKHNIHALVIDNPIDIYYLTQEDVSLGRLVIEEAKATFFVDGRYFEKCRGNPDVHTMLTAGYELNSSFANWWPFHGQKVGFDAKFCTYNEFENLQKLKSNWIAIKNPIGELREIKDDLEIKKLKQAAKLGSLGFDYVLSKLKEGISEKELAGMLEIFWLKAGSDKSGFSPIIAFGENSALPHHKPSHQRTLKKGDLVLIDIGVVLEHYHSDMTRVVCFKEASFEHQKIYEIVLQAHIQASSLCKSGVKVEALDHAARGWIEQKNYKDYFTHGLGHGVGLEIHESPRLHSISLDAKRPLVSNMVVTIEPGIYLPGKFGVRLEDTYIVHDDNCESITDRPMTRQIPVIKP